MQQNAEAFRLQCCARYLLLSAYLAKPRVKGLKIAEAAGHSPLSRIISNPDLVRDKVPPGLRLQISSNHLHQGPLNLLTANGLLYTGVQSSLEIVTRSLAQK